MPATLTPGPWARPALVVPGRAALGFMSAFAARRALGAVAVLAAPFPCEAAPDLLVLAATRLGTALRAAPRFAPAAFPLVAAVPVAGRRRAFPDTVVLGAVLAAAFGAPMRPLLMVPWPPVLVAVVAAAPRRVGSALALLPSFPGASAARTVPAGGFAAALPRAGGPANALASLPTRGAARLAGLFPSFGRDPRHGDRLARSRLWLRAVLGGFRRAAEPARCPSGAAPLEPP